MRKVSYLGVLSLGAASILASCGGGGEKTSSSDSLDFIKKSDAEMTIDEFSFYPIELDPENEKANMKVKLSFTGKKYSVKLLETKEPPQETADFLMDNDNPNIEIVQKVWCSTDPNDSRKDLTIGYIRQDFCIDGDISSLVEYVPGNEMYSFNFYFKTKDGEDYLWNANYLNHVNDDGNVYLTLVTCAVDGNERDCEKATVGPIHLIELIEYYNF